MFESFFSKMNDSSSSSGDKPIKYILVTGGVISGIGKGILASSIGAVLKASGMRITSIKIDPYINIDAGTFSPFEHGEVFVLDDGGEVDLDLGNYERLLDVRLTRENNITTGKIYQSVISKERKGDYLGKTVQVVPHITDEIQNWVVNASKVPVDGNDQKPEICIIELGGTIGDIESMPFVEAFRQFGFRVKRENFCIFHMSIVLQPKATSEDKTKPTQACVREIRSLGLNPDFIICRSEKEILDSTKEKISNFCNVDEDFVLCLPDFPSIYHVPLSLIEQNLIGLLSKRLQLNELKVSPESIKSWQDLSRNRCFSNKVTIAIVGKYTLMTTDAYASIIKALEHAAYAFDHSLDLILLESCDLESETKQANPAKYEKAWTKLNQSDGILIPGGFGIRGINGKIEAIKWCRENNRPMLGICLGLQLAAIEFARNVLKLEDADSIEFNENCKNPIVIDMPEHNQGELGGTMRLGKHDTIFNTENSKLFKLYGNSKKIQERHRHRFEINSKYLQMFHKEGLRFVAQDTSGRRMAILELDNHPYFVGVQYHPEYLSKPNAPSPPFIGLLQAAINTKK